MGFSEELANRKSASWWYDTMLVFSHAGTGTLSHGIYTPGEAVTVEVAGDLQPTSRQRTFFEYGIETDAEYTFYCSDSTPITGDTTEYNGETYIIENTKDWNDYRILYLKKVQTDG